MNALFNPLSEEVDVIVFDGGSKSLAFIENTDKYDLITKVITTPQRTNCLEGTNKALQHLSEKSNNEWVFLLQDDVVVNCRVMPMIPKLIERAPKDAGMLSFTTIDSRVKKEHYIAQKTKKSKYVLYPQTNWYCIQFAAFKRALINGWFTSKEFVASTAKGKNKYRGIDNYFPVYLYRVSKVYCHVPYIAKHIGKHSGKLGN